MASPSIRSSIVTNGSTASATPTINLPATIRAGDTLWVVVRQSAAGAIGGWPTGWNEVVDETADASANQTAMAWKKADGTEGASISLTSGNGKYVGLAYAIQDAADPTVRAPELSTVATGTSAAQPNATIVTPTGGSKDYLFLTIYTMEGEQTGVTSYPTGYTLAQLFANSGTSGLVTTNCTGGGAAKAATASSDDAAAWTVAGTLDDWGAYTVAFHPATPVTAPLDRSGDARDALPPSWFRRASTMAALTIAVNLLQTTLAPTEAAAESPATQQVVALRAATQPPRFDFPNLLLSTLAPSELPFRQSEWPNPQRSGTLLTLHAGAHNLADGEEPPPPSGPPFVPVAFPNPVLKRTVPRGFVDFYLLDTVPWPVQSTAAPTRRPAPTLTWTQNLLQSTLTPATAAAPFSQTEWQNPTRAAQLAHTWTSGRPLGIADAPPFNQFDWPNPKDRKPAAPIHVVNLLEHTLAPAPATKPFAQADWPMPQGKPYAISLRTAITTRQAFHVDERAVGQSEWPNPRHARRSVPTAVANLLTNTLAAAPAPPPVVPPIWTVPSRALAPVPSWVTSSPVVITEIRPFAPREWTNPTRATRQALTWTQSLSADVIAATPIVPVAWPNPAIANRTALTWVSSRPLGINEIQPFNQTDWPLPVRRPVRVAETWVQPHPTYYSDAIGDAGPDGTWDVRARRTDWDVRQRRTEWEYGTMAAHKKCFKDPNEIKDFTFNFRKGLNQGATLASIESITGPAGATLTNQTILAGGIKVSVRITGGVTQADPYDVTAVVWTSDGERLEETGKLYVRDSTDDAP